jgi:hypothetical protein
VLRLLLWIVALLAIVAVVYYYGSVLLSPLPTVTPKDRAAPTPSSTPVLTQTPTPASVEASPSPALGFAKPTPTPTPYPGGAVYSLSPEASAAGWLASDEPRGNHLGDSYLYSGVFDGVIYHGAFQLDLAAVPRGATIHAAVLEITGLDTRRLGTSGVWEVRVLEREADKDWRRHTYQDVHNAAIQWTLPPALSVGNLVPGKGNVFELSREQARDLEQRLLDEHYTVSFRIDGPLAGENSVFAWDTGQGPSTLGNRPRLLLNVGPPPKTPIPTGSPPPSGTPTPSVTPTPSATPTPTDTPVWVVVTSTPTPENVLTAAAVVARETVWAATTGTATATPEFVATATPRYIVVTNTPTPPNQATASYQRSLATANAVLTGTPTPAPHHLATATNTPTSTPTPVVVWLDEVTPTPTLTTTPKPTTAAMPSSLRRKIAFLSDRGGETSVYVLDPASGRVGRLTDRWPYDLALAREPYAPGGEYVVSVRAWTYVDPDSREHTPGFQIVVNQLSTGYSWAITFSRLSYDPVWSPRGDLIAFVSQEEEDVWTDNYGSGADEIYAITPQGTDKQRLTFNIWEWDKHPSFSPDGSQIVFWSNRATGRRQLWIMNTDGSEQRVLLPSAYNDWDPVWIK